MTLLEVCLALALTALMTLGLYAVGLQGRKLAEHSRTATETRSFAKERLEHIISIGLANLSKSSCTLTTATTNESSLGGLLVLQPRVVWHGADGAVATSTNAAYAEVHVDVTYDSTMTKDPITDTYSTIIQ